MEKYIPEGYVRHDIYNESNINKLAESFRQVLTAIGEDPNREGLLKTPVRAAKSMLFLTHGYEQNPKEILTSALFKEDYRQIVVVKDIEIYSMCDHEDRRRGNPGRPGGTHPERRLPLCRIHQGRLPETPDPQESGPLGLGAETGRREEGRQAPGGQEIRRSRRGVRRRREILGPAGLGALLQAPSGGGAGRRGQAVRGHQGPRAAEGLFEREPPERGRSERRLRAAHQVLRRNQGVGPLKIVRGCRIQRSFLFLGQ